MISSINAVIDGKTYDTSFHRTTPARFDLQRFLRKARNKKSEYFVLEVLRTQLINIGFSEFQLK